MRTVRYHVLFALATLVISAAPARAEMTELADFVVRQNQDARSKLSSFRYDYAREFEQHPPGPRRIRARFKGEWRQRGLEQWVREFRHSQYSDDPKDVQDVERIVVVGKRASAAYHVGTSNPNQHEHDDISKPSDAEQQSIRMSLSEDPMFAAFGDGSRLLNVYLSPPDNDRTSWDAERLKDATGNDEFILRQTRPGIAHPILELRLGPGSGWLVTRAVRYSADGHPLVETTIAPRQDPASRAWYPAEIRRVRHEPNADGPPSLYSTTRHELWSFRANVEFPDEQFTADALGLPLGTTLISVTTGGNYVLWKQTKNGLREVRPVPSGRPTPLPLVPAPASSSPPRAWYVAGTLAVVGLLAVAIAVARHRKLAPPLRDARSN